MLSFSSIIAEANIRFLGKKIAENFPMIKKSMFYFSHRFYRLINLRGAFFF